MSRSSRARLAAAAGLTAMSMAAAGCGSHASHASSPVAAAPGILAGSITIGSYQPLTGTAAPGASEIAPASRAYFSYVNAHGGIYHRKIIYRYLDDQGSPALAPSIVHQLVQQDNVLAIFNGSGTAPHLAVAPFLNSARVPDLFAGSGCPCWDSPPASPETFGWQLDYVREGKILGAYVARQFAGVRTGLIYSGDEAGRDGVRGARYEVPARQIVAAERYRPAGSQLTREMAAVRARGAQVVIAFTAPAATAALRLAMARLNYRPHLVVSSAGSDPVTLATLLANASHSKPPGSASALIQGIITDGSLPPAGSASSSWITLFRKIHNQYIPELPFDTNVVDGMAAAYVFTEAMLRAGPHPTRSDLVNAISGGLPQGPAVAPLGYSLASHTGVTGAYIGVIRGTAVVPLGPVMTTDDTPAGPVTPGTLAQPPAPPSGLPPH